jgi:hypothetical protein
MHCLFDPGRQKPGKTCAGALRTRHETNAGDFQRLKTAITIVADIVRSLVLSGIAAGCMLLLIGAASATTGYCLWRLWQRTRR